MYRYRSLHTCRYQVHVHVGAPNTCTPSSVARIDALSLRANIEGSAPSPHGTLLVRASDRPR